VLGGVSRQAHDLRGEPGKHPPATGTCALVPEYGLHLGLELPGVAVVAECLRDPVDLLRRQAERLAEIADRPLRSVGREGRHQRRVLMAIALVDAGDQDLPDVAGEVEVDVGHRGRFLREEAAGEETGLHRVDVAEAGEVADDRADAGAPPPPRRHQRARRVGATDLDRDLAGQLQQVAVQEEETRELECPDDAELPVQSRRGADPAPRPRVAPGQQVVTDVGQLAVGAEVLGRRVAITEVRGELESQSLGDSDGLGHRLRVLGEAGCHHLRGDERRGAVASSLRLARLQWQVQSDRHQRVL
jgi:hypothetical protein